MNEETKFPQGAIRGSDFASIYYGSEIDDWFKRCLADYPNVIDILEAKQDIGMSRTFQALLLVSNWRAKWFDQFKEAKE